MPQECSAQAYLGVIHEQENLCRSGSTYFSGMENLKILQTFCLTGNIPGDALVKELLKYRLLDIVAFVFDTASESSIREKGVVPFIDKIVRLFLSVTPLHCC